MKQKKITNQHAIDMRIMESSQAEIEHLQEYAGKASKELDANLIEHDKIFKENVTLSEMVQNLNSEILDLKRVHKIKTEGFEAEKRIRMSSDIKLRREVHRLKRTMRGMGNNMARLTDLIDDAPCDPPGTESATKID